MARGKTTGKYLPNSASIGFAEWDLPSLDAMTELLNKAIREGFEIATKEYKVYAFFPAEWDTDDDGYSGSSPDDPTTIYVELPLGEDEDFSPRWSFCLTELVDNFISLHECMPSGKLDSDIARAAKALADGLHRLASKIEERI